MHRCSWKALFKGRATQIDAQKYQEDFSGSFGTVVSEEGTDYPIRGLLPTTALTRLKNLASFRNLEHIFQQRINLYFPFAYQNDQDYCRTRPYCFRQCMSFSFFFRNSANPFVLAVLHLILTGYSLP